MPPPNPSPAPAVRDDAGVDRFARAMKRKLASSRADGRHGWDDPSVCSAEYLAQLLLDEVLSDNSPNLVNIGNYAMMLHNRPDGRAALKREAMKLAKELGDD